MLPGSLGGGDGHCLQFQPLEPPTSDIACGPTTGHQPELVVVSMRLPAGRKKKSVRDLTFKKTAGMSEILTDTFIKRHYFCFFSMFRA